MDAARLPRVPPLGATERKTLLAKAYPHPGGIFFQEPERFSAPYCFFEYNKRTNSNDIK